MALRLMMAIPLDFKLKRVLFQIYEHKNYSIELKILLFYGGNFAVGTVIFIVITFFIIFQFAN
jgi:hypothetical protein